METNDSNIKSQQTGGLKLMTVFIAVLALHVVVIGGITVYHLMSGGSADADLTTLDKTHKDLKGADGSAIADGATPDATQGEKSAPIPPAEVATIPQATSGPQAASGPAPVTDQTAPSEVLTPAPMPLTPALSTGVTDNGTLTPTAPIPSELAPPPEPAPAPIASGPVHMPPPAAAPVAPKITHEQTYTVKITDSYKKIAHAHHVSVAELKEANHIKGDVLHTGQKLIIPSAKTLVARTAPAEVPESTSAESVLSESAPIPTASVASAPATASHRHLYTVVKGDTLIKIAHKFKTTATAIMTENNITDPAKLSIGKKLKIPSQESRSAGNSAPASTQPAQVQAQENAPSAQLANFVP